MKPRTRVAMFRWKLVLWLDYTFNLFLPAYHINRPNRTRRCIDAVLRVILP